MAKIQKEAAISDLFDNSSNSLADSWDALREFAYEDSLLARIKANDEAGQQAWTDAAKAGQVMRIC